MKKAASVLALFSAIAMLAGCCGCCGDKDIDTKKSENHKVVKKDGKKVVKKDVAEKAPVARKSEFKKLRKEVDSAVADL